MKKVENIEEKIAKLPVWAQKHIKDLERKQEAALRTLNKHVDQETPSPFYYEEHPCTGEGLGPVTKRFYIQAHTIQCEFDGIELRISAHHYNNQVGVRLSWNSLLRYVGEVAMVPESFNTVRLVAKEDMC